MRFAIGEVYSNTFASIRRSPAILFPATMAFLVPFLVMLAFLFPGEGSRFLYDTRSGSFDSDLLIRFIVAIGAASVISLVGYAWTTQAAAAEVRTGSLKLGVSLRLIGGGTVRVAISYLIVALIYVGAIAMLAITLISVSGSNAGMLLSFIISMFLIAILMTFFSLVPVACAYEQSGPGEAVSLGTMAVRTAFWRVLAFILVTLFWFFLASVIIELIEYSIVITIPGSEILVMAIDAVVSVLWLAFFLLALTHIYAMMTSELEPSPGMDAGEAGFSDSSPVL